MNIEKVVILNLPASVSRWNSQSLAMKGIQEFWESFLWKSQISVTNIETLPDGLPAYQKVLTEADLIICGWNGPIFLDRLREKLGAKAPALIYLAGEGCRGFAYSIGRANSLQTNDAFICVSRAEQKALKLCYPRAKSIISPYPNLWDKNSSGRVLERAAPETVRLLYVGRFSEQKNLHALFWAIKVLRDTHPKLQFVLDLYGAEDNLGSPNMLKQGHSYRAYLENLASDLAISDKIKWHGFADNALLRNFVQSRTHILVSPSLYSEECFGLAPFDSLVRGKD